MVWHEVTPEVTAVDAILLLSTGTLLIIAFAILGMRAVMTTLGGGSAPVTETAG